MTSLTFTVTIKHTSAITRLQFHLKEPCLILFRPSRSNCHVVLFDASAEAQGPQRTLHWHANEVTDLAFTSNGQYLLSGWWGSRHGLVANWKWLASIFTASRGSDSLHLYQWRWSLAAVSTKDNVIHLVSLTSGSTLTVSKSIRGCITSAGAMVKTSTDGSTLLLPGNPGTLQVYDPVKDCVESVLEVAPQTIPLASTRQQSKRTAKSLKLPRLPFPLVASGWSPWTTQQSQSSKTIWLPVWSSGADKTTLGLFWVLSRDPTLIWLPICAFGLIRKLGSHVQHQVLVMVHSNCGRLVLNMEFGLVTMLDLITTMLEEQFVWVSMRRARVWL